jgi:enoyl-CoA hydratase/carnithine racemase
VGYGPATKQREEGAAPVAELLTDRRDGGIVVVTLNHPERRNAVTHAMWRALAETFGALDADPEARAVVLTGAGGNFSAGADISEFDRVRGTAEQAAVYSADVAAAETAIRSIRKPTVAAISGYAVGGGCLLALGCDFRIADRSAQMGIPAARLSIVYGIEATRSLMNVVGAVNAKRILFTGARFGVDEVREMGLVDMVVDDDPVDAAAAYVRRMAENAPLSIQGAKLAINGLMDGEMGARSAAFREIASRAVDSEDYREGRQAFLEKRPPRFKGR